MDIIIISKFWIHFISHLLATNYRLLYGDNITTQRPLLISGLEITASQRTMSELIWELTCQPFVLPVSWPVTFDRFENEIIIKISMLFSCFSCSKSLCIVLCGTLIWNPGWNATRTVVYNSGIENRHQGSCTSGTPEFKCLVTKLFSMNTNFSSLVIRSNMDYWQSFRIKNSHCDTYTRNHYIWRHLLCIYLHVFYKFNVYDNDI